MSSDPEQEYFSDGISEELLNLLARIPELRVIARTSSFAFKGKDVKIADIASELNVAYVLEGSVRQSGDQVRITTQLIRSADSSHVWSETYDRTLKDIFAIQDEIAGAVVKRLKITLLGTVVPKTLETDPEAYMLYLQCRHFSTGTLEGFRKGEQYCRQSLAIDPNYAPAWDALSRVYTNMAISGYISFREGYKKKLEFTRRALELDPNLAQAHAGLGWYAMMYDRDLPAAAAHYRVALKLAPNDASVLSSASVFAETLGRFDRAIELADKGLAVDPLAYVIYGNIATVHCYVGQFEQANARFDKAIELKPNSRGNPWRAKCYLLQGQPENALAEAKFIKSESRRLWILPMALHDLGRHKESDQASTSLSRNTQMKPLRS